jgi:multidrug efflux system membrane fusion protein
MKRVLFAALLLVMLAEPGNVVMAVDIAPVVAPLATITQPRPIYVTFAVSERHLASLRAALASGSLAVTVTIPEQPQSPINGTLILVANQVDAATGTIAMKAAFANDDNHLRPSQIVDVTLQLGVQANAIAVMGKVE